MTSYRPFRKQRSFFLPVLLLLLALLLSLSLFRGLFGVRSLLITAFYPLQLAGRQVWLTTVGIPASVMKLGGLAQENSELKQQLQQQAARTEAYNELESENQRLRAALAFRQGNRYGFDLLPARVIGHGAAPDFSLLQIDRGSSAGIRKDMPVIVREGLVGKVIEVAPLSAKVLLITDSLSSVAGVDQRTRDNGVVNGLAPKVLTMRYVNGGEDMQAGDAIVTSPVSGIFPPGLPVGAVTAISKNESELFYNIELRPAVDFSALEEVFVVF